MNGFQLLMANATVAGLLVLAIPIISITVTVMFLRPHTWRGTLGSMMGVLVSVWLLALAWKTIVDAQDINPLCAGVGDPNMVYCADHGYVPYKVGEQLTTTALQHDLLYCLGIPVLSGVVGLLIVGHGAWRVWRNRSE